MTAAEYTREVEAFLERLRHQQPLAILQYGSSLRPLDFVPGQSDLDLIVISDEPLEDVSNELGYVYAFIPPRDFVSGVAAGDMFWLSALQSGVVRYDPRGFLKHLLALAGSGLELRPNLTTLRTCAALVGGQLGAAMDHYFSGTDTTAGPMLRLLYSTAKALGCYCALASTGTNPHGFDAIVRSLDRFPAVVSLMHKSRERMRLASSAPHEPRPRTHFEQDEVGQLLLEAESTYVREVALLPGRRMTHELITRFQRQHGPLERTLRVRINNTACNHFVIGKTSGHYALFGLSNTRHPEGTFSSRLFSEHEGLKSVLGAALLAGG